MLKEFRPAIVLLLAMTLIVGVFYPLTLTGIAGMLFPSSAKGSLITRDGVVVGSALIGQDFKSDHYFHGRPSATTAPDPADASKSVPSPYNASNSMGSNLGPTSQALADRVRGDVEMLKKESTEPIPVDLVTTSASGLDPHVTPEAALFQVQRVARARNMSEEAVRQLVNDNIEGRVLGIFGEPRVNVLGLNLALDRAMR